MRMRGESVAGLAFPEEAWVWPKLTAVGGLLRGSGMAMAGGLLSQLIKAVLIILVARTFGAGLFGQFSFAMAVNAFLAILSHFGLPLYGAREVATSGAPSLELIRAVARARTMLALAGTVAALALLQLVQSITPTELGLIAGFGLSNVAQSWFVDWVFLGMGRLHWWAAVNLSFQGLWLLLSLPAIRSGGTIVWVAVAAAGAAGGAAAMGWLLLGRRVACSSGRGKHYTAAGVLRTGTHMGTGLILNTALVWSDVAILRLVCGEAEAGVYAAGNRLSLALSMLSGYYVQGAFSSLIQAAAKGREEFARAFDHLYRWLAWLFVPGAVWSWFFAESIVRLLFKRPEYLAAAPVLQVFSAVLLMTTLGVVLYGNGVLMVWRADRIYQRGLAGATAVFLLAAPLAAERYGPLGMAWTALGAQLVVVGLFGWKAARLVAPHPARAGLGPAAAGLGAGLLGRMLDLNLGGALGLLLVAYAVSGGWLAVRSGGALPLLKRFERDGNRMG